MHPAKHLIPAILMIFTLVAGGLFNSLLRQTQLPEREGWRVAFSPTIWEGISLTYSNLLATVKWIEFTAYFGGTPPEKRRIDRLADQLNTITLLNPNFEAAYTFAAVVLPWEVQSNRHTSPLLTKAMQQMPTNWRWPYYAGFNAYWFDNDYEKAAGLLTKAASLPDAPPIIASLALRMQSQAGKISAALIFIEDVLKNATSRETIQTLTAQRNAILTEMVLQEIERQLVLLDSQTTLQQDLKRLMQQGYPVPERLPDGGYITLNRSGQLVSSVSGKRFKVFIPPKRKLPQQ